MKKPIVFAACALMALALAACGGSASSSGSTSVPPTPQSGATSTPASDDSQAEVPNPITEHETIEEAEQAVGFSFKVPVLPDQYAQTGLSTIDGKVAEVDFASDSGLDTVTYRAAKGSGPIDGDYNKYPEEDIVAIGLYEVYTRGADGQVSVAAWEDEGMSYSLAFDPAADPSLLKEIIESLQ